MKELVVTGLGRVVGGVVYSSRRTCFNKVLEQASCWWGCVLVSSRGESNRSRKMKEEKKTAGCAVVLFVEMLSWARALDAPGLG